LRPVDPEKSVGAAHLVLMIDGDSVMDGSAREFIIPRRRSVVEIRSRVARQIDFPATINRRAIDPPEKGGESNGRRESAPRNSDRPDGSIRFPLKEA